MPPGLVLAALGLALAFARSRAQVAGLTLAVLAAAALAFAPWPPAWREAVFLGGWTSAILTAGCVHLRPGPAVGMAGLLGLNAGAWAGGMIALGGTSPDLAEAAAGLLVLPLAAACVRRGATLPPKVVASWLIAVAVLAAALPFLPVTPGYLPDHLD